jgi:hypothetical protein
MTLSRQQIEEIARGAEAAYMRVREVGSRYWYELTETERNTIIGVYGRALALQALDAGQPVAVKPLGWDDSTSGAGRWYALQLVDKLGNVVDLNSRYSIEVHHGFRVKLDDRDVGPICPTLDEAKAAAQADYESRIRTALASPLSSVPADKAEPVAWLANHRFAHDNMLFHTREEAEAYARKFAFDAYDFAPLYRAPASSVEAREVVVVFVPASSQIAVFSSHERATRWAEQHPLDCITIAPIVIDVPEFGNIEAGAQQ